MRSTFPDMNKKALKILHYQQLHNDLLSYCMAPSCGKAFLFKGEMHRHYNRMHLKVKSQCEYCPKAYLSNGTLRLHHEEAHPEKIVKPFNFKCEHSGCKAKYTSIGLLNMHNRKHDTTVKPKKMCPTCGEYRFHLKEHMLLIHGGESHPCERCERSFPSKKALMQHVNDFHLLCRNINVPCPFCGKMLRKRLLKTHIKAVHEKVRFHCSRCICSYTSAHALEYHVKSVHMGIKANCRFCPNAFTRPSDRDRHERRYHGAVMNPASSAKKGKTSML